MPGSGTTGTWVDETDIRPTIMYLLGLKDDYEHDGRVITQVLTHPNRALSGRASPMLGLTATSSSTPASASSAPPPCRFATKGIESNSPGDKQYLATDKMLSEARHPAGTGWRA